MKFPRALSRLLFSPAVIAILLTPDLQARSMDAVTGEARLPQSTREHLVVTPANLAFGGVAIGRRKLRSVTLSNAGDSDVTLLQVVTRGSDFTVSGVSLPLTLRRGQRYTFNGVFSPRGRGRRAGSILFVTEASAVSEPAAKLDLRGLGTDQQVTVDPSTMDFGPVQVGSSGSQAGSLISGGNQVTISAAISSNPEFTVSGLSFPVTIPAGGSQGFLITFTPQTSGMATGTVSFIELSGTDPLVIESLYGTGTNPQGHTVNLSWDASGSRNVIGYNIYRGGKSGGPYTKINSALDASTSYTDNSVTNGNTYYYVTTAVNSDNEESAYSNQAQATIP